MADISDVLAAIEQAVTTTLYPVQPSVAGQSIVGFDILIGIGWPDDSDLTKALRQGRAFVSIYPLAGERNAVVWEDSEIELDRDPPGITVSFNAETATATFYGTAKLNDVVGVEYGGVAYTFPLIPGVSAAALVATLLLGLPSNSGIASGNAFIFRAVNDLRVVVSNNGTAYRNVGQIARRVQLTIWSFDQTSRDLVAKALTGLVAGTTFLDIPAQAGAVEAVKLDYVSSEWNDKPQNAGGYMRTVVALATFQTTIYSTAYAILFNGGTVDGAQVGPVLPGDATPDLVFFDGVPITAFETPLIISANGLE